jgi:serine/threonine protein kinase
MKYCTACNAKYEDSVSFCPVDGEVLEDDPSSIVNKVLDGQYHIESLLGKGGMGAVFLARHILLGDRVAIKILPPEMRNNAEWLRRFRREGQAARRFRHPNAVTVYDLRTAADGMIYMVMEYVEGHTLDAELKTHGNFTPYDAVKVLEPIMSVLNAAHSMGVVHRDLKPENIMIGKPHSGSEPNVKLLDLGIAKLREVAGAETGKNTALTLAGQMLGTPYYMSPEQWGELPRDGNSEIDGRADIYSLGLVFYEMIAGRRPYSALTLLELRKEHVSVMPRRLDEVAPGVSRAFADVIARAMAKDRSDRPATAGDLAAELNAALTSMDNGASQRRFGGETPAGSASPADTVAINSPSLTSSDVNAATILTLDEAPATPSPTPPTPPAAPVSSVTANASSQTIAESSTDLSSSITVPQASKTPPYREAAQEQPAAHVPAPTPSPAVPQAQPSRRGATGLVIGGLLVVVVLIVVGVGGFFIVNSMRNKPSGTGGPTTVGTTGTDAAAPREVARYWIEVSTKTKDATPVRVVPTIPVASGQLFKFHFTPNQDGYLYIVGPGDKNKLMAFLTAKPAARESGVATNEVKKGADFSFPTGSLNGEERWFELDKKPGAETYIFIFSPTPLTAPQFLGAEATLKPLSDTEQLEFESFVAKYKGSAAQTEFGGGNSDPFVMVKLPAANGTANPLILDLRIEHK